MVQIFGVIIIRVRMVGFVAGWGKLYCSKFERGFWVSSGCPLFLCLLWNM